MIQRARGRRCSRLERGVCELHCHHESHIPNRAPRLRKSTRHQNAAIQMYQEREAARAPMPISESEMTQVHDLIEAVKKMPFSEHIINAVVSVVEDTFVLAESSETNAFLDSAS